MSDAESNLRAAERVASLLVENGAPAVVIGAVALAAHRYVRLHGLDGILQELD
ncbi:MAG: hypothetical protein WCS43_12950 [Verrucomicrobiota bacterium]